LAAHERLAAVPNNRASMQAHAGKRRNPQVCAPCGYTSYDFDIQARLGMILEETQDLLIGDLGVVDQQLFLGLLDESRELLACIRWANHESVETSFIGLTIEIRLE